MNSRSVWASLLLAGSAISPAFAQLTARQQAVAIDRVPIPPVDRYEVEQVGPLLAAPWSLAFLPDGSFLVSEKHGGVRIIAPNGSATPALPGGPANVFAKEDSGLLDIVLDPDFAANHMIYLAFAEGTQGENRTAIWKARLERDRLADGRVIFRTNTAKKDSSHPGGRLLFLPDKTLLLTVGDGFAYRDRAQDPSTHLGKILRLTRDGGVPPGNPFVGRAGYAPEIWTLGHRNPQGLTRDPVTGTIWEHEHGPRGGDEINELVAGRNYGWPRASFGIDYSGELITDRQHVDGLTDPRFFWAPSIAPSGLAIYHGALHPEWEGRLLIGSLAFRMMAQVRIGEKTGLLAEEGRWLTGLKARIRDIRVAPDGNLYILTDEDHGRLLRVLAPGGSAIAADSPLAPMAYLVGNWTAQSTYTAAFQPGATPVGETSTIGCTAELKSTYIRCAVRFYRNRDGRLRTIEHNIHKDAKSPGFDVLLFDSNWPGQPRYTLTWSDAEQAWIGYLPGDHEGAPATERIMDQPSADRSTVLHTESIRLNSTPNAPWTETFRWTWTRRPQ
ncbi:PQQ-dependent sugar dehydrogenase [Sphingomonas sp. URHD0057]|uniref:PQQ-dependent sugar dehydrogenase n=1 Tax=Sphingomonas sp. URHD0057 TaxID=1380389 RepID=UPI000688C028|nr:PQQ-dependent sugar dehydrogenase [Sphingomonas sp. URHD0057]